MAPPSMKPSRAPETITCRRRGRATSRILLLPAGRELVPASAACREEVAQAVEASTAATALGNLDAEIGQQAQHLLRHLHVHEPSSPAAAQPAGRRPELSGGHEYNRSRRGELVPKIWAWPPPMSLGVAAAVAGVLHVRGRRSARPRSAAHMSRGAQVFSRTGRWTAPPRGHPRAGPEQRGARCSCTLDALDRGHMETEQVEAGIHGLGHVAIGATRCADASCSWRGWRSRW